MDKFSSLHPIYFTPLFTICLPSLQGDAGVAIEALRTIAFVGVPVLAVNHSSMVFFKAKLGTYRSNIYIYIYNFCKLHLYH
jgi:hypothetical protein